jgi:hypothetical protein
MVLQVKRTLHGRTWWFELKIVQDYWQDLCEATEQGPETVAEAYAQKREFWDWLAEQNADRLEGNAVPGSPDRHIPHVWPDYPSLETAYRKHRP